MNDSLKPTADLAPDYYVKNFRFLVDWVRERYADLLNAQELLFIDRFYQLSHGAQCLLVRLSSRKGPVFRRDKLDYPEIQNIDSSAQELIAAALLSVDTPLSIEGLANTLTKPELLLVFSSTLLGVKQARKDDLIVRLTAEYTEPQTWQAWTQNQFGEAWYLDNAAIIDNLLLLFFGNAYQDLTEFVLQDLGLFRYEDYTIDPHHRVFKNREELEQYHALIQMRIALAAEDFTQTAEDSAQATEKVMHTLMNMMEQLLEQTQSAKNNSKVKRRHANLCNQIAYRFEQMGEHNAALQLYEQSHLPPARERRIRLLEKQERYADAWQLLSILMQAPLNEHELQIAQRMAPRLAKKAGTTYAKKTSTPINEKHISLSPRTDENGNRLRVEDIVRHALHEEKAPCVYVENTLINALFGLWLWPEMFRGIEGAFANPFQTAPLDLYHENFVAHRPQLNERWALFDNNHYQQAIRQTWQDKYGIANHFIHWPALTRDLLDMALHSIPASHLKKIFERILFDIQHNRSGFPDLIQFFPEQQTYRLIEVKGPGDRIQDNQQRWLDYFTQHHIPAEVYYVAWQ